MDAFITSEEDWQISLNLNANDFEFLDDMIQKAKQIARDDNIKRSRAIFVQRPKQKNYHKSIHLNEDGRIISHYRWGKICEVLQDQMEFFVNSIPDQDIKDGMNMDEIRNRFEQQFGVNITNNGMSKFKNFHQYFDAKRMTRNGWRGNFY